VDVFPILCDYTASKHRIDFNTELIFSDIQQQSELLSDHFTKYFLKGTHDNSDWILNAFFLKKLIF